MQQQYEEWEVEEMILLELRLVFILGVRVSVFLTKILFIFFSSISLDDLQRGVWYNDVATFLALENREFLGEYGFKLSDLYELI